VSFFEPPPPADPGGRLLGRPSWIPTNEVGAAVPLRLVLARTEQVAVVLVGGTAYSTGVVLGLAVRSQRHAAEGPYEDGSIDFFDFPFGSPHTPERPPGELPDDLLRFGVQFSDGRKATTVGSRWPRGTGEPTGPLLQEVGASFSDGIWDGEFWLWPLPPPGTVTFAVEWPLEELALAKHEVDAALFIDASKQSEVLWPEAGSGGGSGSSRTESIVFELESDEQEDR
jgi:hypothetical protein